MCWIDTAVLFAVSVSRGKWCWTQRNGSTDSHYDTKVEGLHWSTKTPWFRLICDSWQSFSKIIDWN